jgi:hypothetical protein
MIDCLRLRCSRSCWIITLALFVWFVMFPEDLTALVSPVRTVLDLTRAVSPWLYGLAAVALVCWTFGRRFASTGGAVSSGSGAANA